MIELRYRKAKDGDQGIIRVATGMNEPMELYVMQYRTITTRIDATGALNVLPDPVEWTDWQDAEISDEVD